MFGGFVKLFVSAVKLAAFAAIATWVGSRWKRLGACAAMIVAALYAHGEFLRYVDALPADSEQAAVANAYVALSFVLKHTLIVGALLAYLLLEVRAWRRAKRLGRDARPRPRRWWWRRGTANRRGRDARARTTLPRKAPTPEGALPPADAGCADDGFDFLRRKRELESRAQKVIKRKPER